MGNPRGKRSGYPLWKLALLIFCVLPTILLGSETGKSQQHDAKLLSDPEKMGQTEGEENFEGDDDESDKLETIKERGEKLADDNASDPINEPNKNRGRSAQRTANMVHTIRSCFNENALRRTGKRKVLPTFSYVTGNPLVELATVVDHVDINNLNVLASCIRFYLPENVEDRQFDGEYYYFSKACSFRFSFPFFKLKTCESQAHLPSLILINIPHRYRFRHTRGTEWIWGGK